MVKIIHGADFHLDSPFSGLTPERAAQRRGEQRELLARLADLAREERADLWGERPHALGRLPGPLYQFVGSFPQLLEAQGAQLTQGEERYRVLGAQEVTLGGRRLFERALLERWVEG